MSTPPEEEPKKPRAVDESIEEPEELEPAGDSLKGDGEQEETYAVERGSGSWGRRDARFKEKAGRTNRMAWKKFPWLIMFGSLGALAVVSLILTMLCLSGKAPVAVVAKAPAVPSRPMSLRGDKEQEDEAAPLPMTPEQLEIKQQFAETELRMKDYAGAEAHYREILGSTNRKPLASYQIFVCMVLEGRRAEAEQFITGATKARKTPAFLYAEGTVLFLDGRAEEAREKFTAARAAYPTLTPYYDSTLRAVGCEL